MSLSDGATPPNTPKAIYEWVIEGNYRDGLGWVEVYRVATRFLAERDLRQRQSLVHRAEYRKVREVTKTIGLSADYIDRHFAERAASRIEEQAVRDERKARREERARANKPIYRRFIDV